MKMLLLIIPLLIGCTREYTCDAGPPCVSDIEESDTGYDIYLDAMQYSYYGRLAKR